MTFGKRIHVGRKKPGVLFVSPEYCTVSRKCSPNPRPAIHHPTPDVSNKFSPLSKKPAEKPSLVIGSSIFRNVKVATPERIVNFFPPWCLFYIKLAILMGKINQVLK